MMNWGEGGGGAGGGMDSEMQQRNEKGQKEIQEGSEVIGETEGYDIKALTLIHDNRVQEN